MKVNVGLLKNFLIFCVGLFLPWGRNALMIGIYPPLFFVLSTLCLVMFIPREGIRIPFAFRWYILFMLFHIVITIALLGERYLYFTHVETQFLGAGRSFVRPTPIYMNIAQIMFLIFFFVVMTSVVRKRNEWIVFANSFIWGLTLICFAQLTTYSFMSGRFTGGYNNANIFGIAACVAFFLSFMMMGMYKNYVLKTISIAQVVFFLAMILLSQSRGSFVALVIGLLIILKAKRYHIYKIAFICGSVLLIGFLIWPLFPDRFIRVHTWIYDRGSTRLDIWSIYLSRFWDYFLTGVGYVRSADVISTGILQKEQTTHNIFLEMWVEFGIVGFLLFCLVLQHIWTTIRRIPKAYFYRPELKAVFLSWLISSSFISALVHRETWFVFALMASLPALVTPNKEMNYES